jgi:hypothetical protein
MRSLQLAVVLVLLISLITMSTAQAQTLDGLVMVDSTGKTLGPVLDINGVFFRVPHVPFTVGNSVFVLSVFKTRFAGTGIPPVLHFNSKRCNHQTGQAAAALSDLTTIDAGFWSFVGADGGTVYIPTANVQPIHKFNALSRLTVEPNGNVECQDIAQMVSPAIPATPVANMLTFFTPPYTVEAANKKGK